MPSLQIWNDQIVLSVFSDGRLEFQSKANDKAKVDLQEGSVEVAESAPVTGLYYYAMPCAFEQLVLRVEGKATPVLNRAVGTWPAAVEEDELETYPYLHFLEERKTGLPWRFERWYTLAGPYLIFDSEQYFERACPRQHGKDWERLIVQVRQVVDLVNHSQRPAMVGVNLISEVGTASTE